MIILLRASRTGETGITQHRHCQQVMPMLQKEKRMKPNTKIEISLFGALVISAAIWALAAATSRLVDSFVSEGAESGDWSIDEKEYGTN